MAGREQGPAAAEDPAAVARRQRLWLLGASAVAVAVVVIVAIAVGGAGGGESGTTTGTPEGIAATRALFAGIPQRGEELGSPDAQVTVTEFADLQCPFCGQSARDELPDVVRDYVRPGRARLVFRALAFLGDDSERGAAMAAAAGMQNRLWQFVDLVYRNQGAENSGWVSDAYLRRVATAAGLDVRRAFADRTSAAAGARLEEAHAAANSAGVKSTPTFVVERRGARPRLVQGDLRDAIADALE
jgi:protein-disulfide isomerase